MTSLIHLEALWKFKQNQLEKEINDTIRDWNKKYKCKCCKDWKIGNDLIECKHIEKIIIKKYGKRNRQQFKNALFLGFLTLNKVRYNSVKV